MKPIHCPLCNLRLFDAKDGSAQIEIKCARCRKIIKIELKKPA